MTLEKGYQHLFNSGGSWRVYFQPDNTGVATQGQYNPIPEVFVECYQYPALATYRFEDVGIVHPLLADLSRADDIMPVLAETVRDLLPHHLVDIEPHV